MARNFVMNLKNMITNHFIVSNVGIGFGVFQPLEICVWGPSLCTCMCVMDGFPLYSKCAVEIIASRVLRIPCSFLYHKTPSLTVLPHHPNKPYIIHGNWTCLSFSSIPSTERKMVERKKAHHTVISTSEGMLFVFYMYHDANKHTFLCTLKQNPFLPCTRSYCYPVGDIFWVFIEP